MSRWLKVLIWIVVIALAVVVLFTVVFPRVERILEDPTMGATHLTGPADLTAQAERAAR